MSRREVYCSEGSSSASAVIFKKVSSEFPHILIKEMEILQPVDIDKRIAADVMSSFYPEEELRVGQNNLSEHILIGVHSSKTIEAFDWTDESTTRITDQPQERMLFFGGKLHAMEKTKNDVYTSPRLLKNREEATSLGISTIFESAIGTFHAWDPRNQIIRISQAHAIFESYKRAQLAQCTPTLCDEPWSENARFKIKIKRILIPSYLPQNPQT